MPDARDAFAVQFNVSRETMRRLDCYAALLVKWQKTLNLVGAKTLNDLWTRHFADSAQILSIVPIARRWADLGSGAGFPGLVIALLLGEAEGTGVDLIEVDQRKCAFLREVARETQAPVRILNERIQSAVAQLDVEVVTSRAVADLSTLVEWAGPLLKKGAIGVFPKGRNVDLELTAIAAVPNIKIDLAQSLTDRSSRIVLVRSADIIAAESNPGDPRA